MSFYELLFGFTPQTKTLHPEIFAAPPHHDREHGRILPMQVLSMGFSRTGTASMQAALEILGYPCSHGFNMYTDIEGSDLFWEAYQSKYLGQKPPKSEADWKQFFDTTIGHVSAVTDVPSASFPLELMAAYPDAKVVLVERDVETWMVSYDRIFIKPTENPIYPWIAWLDPATSGRLWRLLKAEQEGHFGVRDARTWRVKARDVYRRHYAGIRAALKDSPERLLEYKLGSGWEPLCQFLDKPVPDVPFPRVNEVEMMEAKSHVFFVKSLRITLGKIPRLLGWTTAVLAAAWLVQWSLRS